MPEIRAGLSDELHSLLKQEAARKRSTLKALIVEILEAHVEKSKKE